MDSLPQQLLLQAVLIFLNAFFAATEIAVLSLNQTVVENDAEQGNKTAKRLLKMMEQPSGFLSTIQVGITLAGFLGSAFAADNFSEYLVNWLYNDVGLNGISMATLDTISVIIITLILSYVTLILGELVPKRIAMQKPYQVAKFTSGVVNGVAIIMKPIVFFLSLSTNLVLKLLRMDTESEEDQVTEEEIRMMVNLGGKRGILEQTEKDWINNVFEFNDITVSEVMTQRSEIISIDTDDTPDEILELIKECKYSRIPVYDKSQDFVPGILYANDFLKADSETRKNFLKITRTVYFVPENLKASELFEKMRLEKMHMAVAVDEYGSVSGLVTMEDLLEIIVGNIYDENDESEEEDVIEIAENTWKVQGDCSIKKFTLKTGIKLESKDRYHTMGGVVINITDSIPDDGSEFTVQDQGLEFHVTAVENRRITEMIVKKLLTIDK